MDLRLRFFALALVGLVAVAVWTFPAWRVYFRDPAAAAGFPGLEMDLQDEFLALEADEREQLLTLSERDPQLAMARVLVAIGGPAAAPEDSLDEAALESARVLVSGDFIERDALHWGAGKASIYQLADERRILRFEAFNSAPAGDARVYLARDFQPLTELELGDDFLDLGQLKGNVGDQRYYLPADHDLSAYHSTVIFSRQFDAVITVATLR